VILVFHWPHDDYLVQKLSSRRPSIHVCVRKLMRYFGYRLSLIDDDYLAKDDRSIVRPF
jgi:hypothetical protein